MSGWTGAPFQAEPGCPFYLAAGSLGKSLAVACSLESSLPANQQTALRLACNCFLHTPLMLWIQRQVGL